MEMQTDFSSVGLVFIYPFISVSGSSKGRSNLMYKLNQSYETEQKEVMAISSCSIRSQLSQLNYLLIVSVELGYY